VANNPAIYATPSPTIPVIQAALDGFATGLAATADGGPSATSRKNNLRLVPVGLMRQLASYVASLTADEFKRALVFLRRAFGEFSPAEKRSITENLGQIWGVNQAQVSEVLSAELSEQEKQKLDELSGFDFEAL